MKQTRNRQKLAMAPAREGLGSSHWPDETTRDAAYKEALRHEELNALGNQWTSRPSPPPKKADLLGATLRDAPPHDGRWCEGAPSVPPGTASARESAPPTRR